MEKKYYSIEIEIDRKIMGDCYPQIELIEPVHIADSLTPWNFPKINTPFEITLHKNSKLTDVLNNLQVNSSGFMISKKLKNILDSFTLMNHKYYPVRIKGINESYYWLHLCDMQLTYNLDYSNTIFFQTKYNSIQNEIKLSSFNEYVLLKNELGTSFGVKLIETTLSNDFLKGLDLFRFIPFTGSEIFISEELKTALEENQIVGFNFQRAEKIKNL